MILSASSLKNNPNVPSQLKIVGFETARRRFVYEWLQPVTVS